MASPEFVVQVPAASEDVVQVPEASEGAAATQEVRTLVAEDWETLERTKLERKLFEDAAAPALGPPPREALSGVAQGVSSMVVGVGAGLGILVAAPVMGAAEGTLSGFARGVGVGVFGAVALPVAGVTSGLCSIVRGVFSTPSAVKGAAQGKDFDGQTGQRRAAPVRPWVHYDLEADSALLLSDRAEAILRDRAVRRRTRALEAAEGEAASAHGPPRPCGVACTELYETLEVSVDASEVEIRRAYYKISLACHPDKVPGQEARFQAVSRAYTVLADPSTRRRYDERGAVDDDDAGPVEPQVLFAMVFGSEAFEKYVGELYLATAVRLNDAEAPDIDFIQRQRRCRLAATLAHDVLAPYVDASELMQPYAEERFRGEARRNADALVGTAFGATLLRAVAYVYGAAASRYLSGALGATLRDGRDLVHGAQVQLDALSAAAKVKAAADAALKSQAKYDAAATSLSDHRAETTTRDGYDLFESMYNVVVQVAPGEWQTTVFRDRTAAVEYFASVGGRKAKVLFERAADFEWRAVQTAGAAAGVAAIKREVARAALAHVDIEQTTASAAEAEALEGQRRMLGKAVEAAWRLSVLDLEATLRDATTKLFRDRAVDVDTRAPQRPANERRAGPRKPPRGVPSRIRRFGLDGADGFRAGKRRARALQIVADEFLSAAAAARHAETWQEQLAKHFAYAMPAE